MRLSIYLIALLTFCGSLSMRGQDVHFTLHDYNPLWLNPAHTGAFNGSVRIGGIYRGQWYSINGISTPSAYADAPIIRGLRKYDWIGVGANLISDKAGNNDLGLKSTFFGFSAAYHLALDNRRRNVITLGAQYGSTSYSLDVGSADLIQQITIDQSLGGGGLLQGELTPNNTGGGGNMGGGNNNSYNDINAGVMLRSVLDPAKDNLFEAGISMLHINSPKRQSLVMAERDTMMNPNPVPVGDEDTRRRRPTLHAHARLDLEMSENWRFQPTLFAQTSASVTTVSVQAWGSRNLKPNVNLRLGLGYRTGDAAQVLVGLDYEKIRAALSYDITLSQARAVTNYQGAFELSAQYLFNIYKKPTVVPTMLCPQI